MILMSDDMISYYLCLIIYIMLLMSDDMIYHATDDIV